MQLFIRSGDLYTEIPSVTLRAGYIPVVGDHNQQNSASDSSIQIEPAIWFKVLVLDSISIDCSKRAIMWNSDAMLTPDGKKGSGTNHLLRDKQQDESPLHKRKRISQSMYIGGEFYGFESELDELFDTMQVCVSNVK